MGSYDFKAGILTSGNEADHEAIAERSNAPVLRIQDTSILLPCGSKQGWPNAQQHASVLESIQQLGGRVITVESDFSPPTTEAPVPDASWLLLGFVDNEAQSTPERHIVELPVGDFRLGVSISAEYPEDTRSICVAQLPKGFTLAKAQWLTDAPGLI